MFDHLVNGDVATEVIFAKLPDGAYGKNKLRKQPSQEMWQATITLDLDNITPKAQRYGITTEQATSSTFGHEIRHTEDKNIQMQLRTKDSYKEIPYADREEEKDADAVSFQIINEYKNKMNENETNLLHILFMYLGRLFR